MKFLYLFVSFVCFSSFNLFAMKRKLSDNSVQVHQKKFKNDEQNEKRDAVVSHQKLHEIIDVGCDNFCVVFQEESLFDDLIAAIKCGDSRKCKDLIKQDMSLLQAQDQDGNTPLHLAIIHSQYDIAQSLAHCIDACSEGDIFSILNNDSESAFDCAVNKSFYDKNCLPIVRRLMGDIEDAIGWSDGCYQDCPICAQQKKPNF